MQIEICEKIMVADVEILAIADASLRPVDTGIGQGEHFGTVGFDSRPGWEVVRVANVGPAEPIADAVRRDLPAYWFRNRKSFRKAFRRKVKEIQNLFDTAYLGGHFDEGKIIDSVTE
jgi:hypothetical protein